MTRGLDIPLSPQFYEARFLRDCRLGATKAGLSVPEERISEWKILGAGLANLGLLASMQNEAAETTRNVLNMTSAELDEELKARDLPPESATTATGAVTVTITGTATIPEGLEFTYSSGAARGRVVQTYEAIGDGTDVDVESITVGEAANANPGAEITWVNQPTNVASKGKISGANPLSDATDEATPARKLERILDHESSNAAGENWTHIRDTVKGGVPSLQECYVYPALGGPSSQKTVLTKKFDRTYSLYTRAPNSAEVIAARNLVHTKFSGNDNHVLQAVADEPVDYTLRVRLPTDSTQGGWLDATPWPQLETADNGRVWISAVSSDGYSITVSAQTATLPSDMQTRIAWWSSVDQKFKISTVLSSSGSVGARVLNLLQPFTDSNGDPPQAGAGGDYICPASTNIENYHTAWVDIFESLGPGENTTDSARIGDGRSLRHPLIDDTRPSDMSAGRLCELQTAHPEISGAAFEYAPQLTPTVPSLVATAPNVLTPRNFAIYPE